MKCPECSADVSEDLKECTGCGASLSVEVMGPDGQAYGPYSVEALRRYVAEGRVNPNVSRARMGEGDVALLGEVLSSAGIYIAAPPPPPVARPAPSQRAGSSDEWLAKQVPYRNATALTSYYLGVFSVVPCIGLLLALGAVPCGIAGLGHAKKHPESHGASHAWTGIVLGTFSLVGHVALFIWMSTQ